MSFLAKSTVLTLLGLEFVADGLVLGDELFQRLVNVPEQLARTCLKNSLVTASTLKASSMSRQRRVSSRCLGAARESASARCGSFRPRRRCRKNGEQE